ncbi:hypothetical protein K491DRAFT_723120 [Lophiostoma macrostomum CBS 122681]|uniref:Uncharacterized protein n=1 Tax=Lophiostoma macrostomum CBS 122681 TaxID=1314788 RepID=A0A6A6SLH1_9PLEO|nr:hypothetical protein K491DRAFT_723120 [Lophiostoma macrostomum CBS 122681]
MAAVQALKQKLRNSGVTGSTIETEEEKDRKDRARQERQRCKNLKERRLETEKANVTKQEELMNKAREEIEAADRVDDQRITAIRNMQEAREAREGEERRRKEYEKYNKLRKGNLERLERERLEREWEAKLAEAQRQQQAQAEAEAAERGRQEEYEEDSYNSEYACDHGGWWAKVKGRQNCLVCYSVRKFLLECPGCQILACPKCQVGFRPYYE